VGELLHRFDAGTLDLTAPLIEELSGPGRGVVIPELLRSFIEAVHFEKIALLFGWCGFREALTTDWQRYVQTRQPRRG
jgi:hypothetical protein